MVSGSRRLLAGAALIAAMAVLCYLPALKGGFIWDDDRYLTNNEAVKAADGLGRIWFTPGATIQYYPLVFTSFWLEYRLWGLLPQGYHLTNVLLHALNAGLLCLVLTRLSLPGAWLAAAIFALHPVQVESVAWITERKNLLSVFFCLLAVLFYQRYGRETGSDRDGGRHRAYVASLLCFLAALLSKTVSAALPAALLPVIWWREGSLGKKQAAPLVPFFILGFALGSVTVWMETFNVNARGPDWDFSPAERVLIAGRALWFYAGKLAWPSGLTFIYPRWNLKAAAWWHYLYPAAALAVVAALLILRRKIGRGPAAGVLFFILSLAPALGLINFYPMLFSFVADHFQYPAGIGLIALFAAGYARISARAAGKARLPARLLVPAALLCVLGLATWRQTAVYHDEEALWEDTLRKNPEAWLAHNNLGILLAGRGRVQAALGHFQSQLKLRPDALSNYNVGLAYKDLGRTREAVEFLTRAADLDPAYDNPRYHLGLIMEESGRAGEAAARFGEVAMLRPADAEARYHLGLNLLRAGRTEEGTSQIRKALELRPDYAAAREALARSPMPESSPLP